LSIAATLTALPATVTLALPSATPLNGCVADACVQAAADSLRLRAAPYNGTVIEVLAANAALTVRGSNSAGDWLYVTAPSGYTGWVAAAYVQVNLDWALIPLVTPMTRPPIAAPNNPPIVINPSTNNPAAANNPAPNAAPILLTVPYVSGMSANAQRIFAIGQARGNRADVFAKVGDSLTVATWVFYPIGWGQQQLGAYGDLQGVIAYFSRTPARDQNSFAQISLAAENGWTSASVLNPANANPNSCQAGETPLACEYRLVRPSVALILLGTNDVASMSAADYQANMQRIVDFSAQQGVIPILTTLPPRMGFEAQVNEFNAILRMLSQQNGVPLLDYGAAMLPLPNQGLSADGVHPSWASVEGDWASAAHFSPANLQYGYTLRNLTALYALQAVWQAVLSR
jgi:hypothetical protein